MVVAEGITELQLIFPADLEALYDTQALKQGDGPVYAGPIRLSVAGRHQIMHSLWLTALEGSKYQLTRSSQALAVFL